MKRPNSYALYLCHAAVQSDTEAAAKKAKANEEWYEHNKEWKKEYNQEYYQQNKEYWEKRYAEQKSSADRAEENMKRAQQEYADYSRSNNTQPTTNNRITTLKSGTNTGTSSNSASTTEGNKNKTVTKPTSTTAASSDSKYDLSSITKEEMDIANKVIRGDFKNGKKRKELLKKYIEENKANVDPVKIQKYVNILAKVGYNWNKSGIKTPASSASSNSTKASSTKSSSNKSKSTTKKTTSKKTTTTKKNTTTKALVNAKLANDTNAQAKALALYNH